ncbi:MAG TPA: aminotransferase class I/II-fold pyridoxal phosphate-dependent enzyme, partial [Symbiobacteriaceae bacterium]|nr:aminotransferase class I/II-fold pyridoxal phosphate-dependent enzyme [Symbiobacteriaceae bacterium]HWI60710.1 aminotransferase class I/II-fold pyridoxal phosphate-dependent enzyme [Symbiobacteriaceae bacterium]
MPKRAERIATVPPYLFAEIDKKKAAAIARGVDVISLGIGDPDMPTPSFVVDKMKQAVADPRWHQYPDYDGSLAYRTAVTQFYKKRFGIELNPKTEALALIGSKEGIAHII